MSLDYEIRTRAADYVNGRASLRDFYGWLIPATWDVELTGNQEAIRLASELGLRIAEFTSKHLTEAALKQHIREAIAQYVVPSAVSIRIVTASTAKLLALPARKAELHSVIPSHRWSGPAPASTLHLAKAT